METNTPPPADGSDSADTALRCLYPYDHLQTFDLRQNSDISAEFARLVAVLKEIAQCERDETELKQRIQQRMADANRAVFESGVVNWASRNS